MSIKSLFTIVIIGLCATAARSQEERWDTYVANFGDKPGSMLVDMSLVNTAPDSRYPFLVITGPKAHACSKQGLPDKDEIPHLEEMLDATGGFLSGVTAKVLVATFTYNCERLNYYYVKDTVGVHNALVRLYKRNYSDYRYAINMRYDPEWTTYRTFLYPSGETLAWMENNRVISALRTQGDSLTQERDINFEVYFTSDTDRKAFANFAVEKGYKIKRTIDAKGAYAIVVYKHDRIRSETINAMTGELKKAAEQHNGVFHGWNAPLK